MSTSRTHSLTALLFRSRAGIGAALAAGVLCFGLTGTAYAGEREVEVDGDEIEVEVENHEREIEIELEHGELSDEDRAMIKHDEALTIYSNFEGMNDGNIDIKRRKDGDVEAKYETTDGTKVSMSVESDGEVEVERRNIAQKFKYDYEKDEDGKVEIEITRRGKLNRMSYEYDRSKKGIVDSEYEGPRREPTTVTATDQTVTITESSPEKELRDNFARVHFEFDKSDLGFEARELLDRNAEILKEHAQVNVTIQGHTDESGSDEYNEALGSRRAEAVFDYLVAQGVDSSQLSTVSYGETTPLLEIGEKRTRTNRRAEFKVTSGNSLADSSMNNDEEQRRFVPNRG